MINDENDLAYWRDRIDRTDGELRALIAKRMSCAREVARIKSAHEARNPDAPVIYYRPGREAQMMRRLAADGVGQSGGFPAAGLIQIWRELISASIEHQADGLRVAVSDASGLALARAHFGAASDIREREDPLADLAADKVMVSVLGWQEVLNQQLPDGQSVIAALPFVGTPTHAVIGAQAPEESGDDRALFRVDDAGVQDALVRGARSALISLPTDVEPPTGAMRLGLFATPLNEG